MLILVLDNIRSLYNVGSMFRTGDAFGVTKIYLCGITGTPEQRGLQKVALGAEQVIPWEHRGRTWAVVEELKRTGYFVIGLERTPGARNLSEFHPPKNRPVALVVGNEVRGLTPVLMRRLDAVVEIPMAGVKESLNVSVAAGIAMHELSRSLGTEKRSGNMNV